MTAQEYIQWVKAETPPYQAPWWQDLQRTLPSVAKRIALEWLDDVPEWLQIEMRRELIRRGAI